MAFHWKDGWYFERTPLRLDGTKVVGAEVHIWHEPPATPGQPMLPPDVDIVIDADSWASIVASVCTTGETTQIYNMAKALHGMPSA